MKTIQIVFCILACLLVALGIPAAVLWGWMWFFVCAAGAALSAAVMTIAKRRSEPKEPPRRDFMDPEDGPEEPHREEGHDEQNHEDK